MKKAQLPINSATTKKSQMVSTHSSDLLKRSKTSGISTKDSIQNLSSDSPSTSTHSKISTAKLTSAKAISQEKLDQKPSRPSTSLIYSKASSSNISSLDKQNQRLYSRPSVNSALKDLSNNEQLRPRNSFQINAQNSSFRSSVSKSVILKPQAIQFTYLKKVFTQQKSFTQSLLAYVPRKPQIIAVGDSQIALWDVQTYELLSSSRINNIPEVNNICYLENVGLVLLSSWKTRELQIWSIKANKLRFHSRKKLLFLPMSSIQINKSEIVCTSSMVRELLFWSSRSEKTYFKFLIPTKMEVRALVSLEKKCCIGVGCLDGTVFLMNFVRKQVIVKWKLSSGLGIMVKLFPPFMRYSKSLGLLFVGSCNSTIEVLKIIDKEKELSIVPVKNDMSKKDIRDVYIFEEEKAIVTIHDSQIMNLWDPKKLQITDSIQLKVAQAFCIAANLELKQIAVSELFNKAFSLLKYE